MVESLWEPHTTVAAIVERDGKFLLVTEKVKAEIVFNQPAEWMSYDEIKSCREHHRSPLVMQGIEDYLHRQPCPLDIFSPKFA